MELKALDSANSKLLSNISAPQQPEAAGKASEADTVSLFSLNAAENAQSPEMAELAATLDAEAQQKIAENEAKNQAIFNKVVEKIVNQINDSLVEQAAALALREQDMPQPEIDEKAANGGNIDAASGFKANALRVHFLLLDNVSYKAVVDGKVVNQKHLTCLSHDFSKEINDDVFKKIVKEYINEKNYLNTAWSIPKGEKKVLEADKDGNPLISVSRDKDTGDITFACTKADSYCTVKYKNEEPEAQESPVANSNTTDNAKSDLKTATNTAFENKSAGMNLSTADFKIDLMPKFNALG